MRGDKSDNASFLSQEGVDHARQIGEKMQSEDKKFAMVVTSTLNRAIQTPIAMGYSVDKTTDELFIEPQTMTKFEQIIFDAGISWSDGFGKWQEVLGDFDLFKEYAISQINLYRSLLDQIKEEESLLIVSHGGLVEFPLIFMFKNANFEKWGPHFGYCEGYRASYKLGNFEDLQLLRE